MQLEQEEQTLVMTYPKGVPNQEYKFYFLIKTNNLTKGKKQKQ
jgi:hypothetical protein